MLGGVAGLFGELAPRADERILTFFDHAGRQLQALAAQPVSILADEEHFAVRATHKTLAQLGASSTWNSGISRPFGRRMRSSYRVNQRRSRSVRRSSTCHGTSGRYFTTRKHIA